MPKKKKANPNRHNFQVIPGEGRLFSFSRLKQALVFYILLLLALLLLVQLGYHWLGEEYLAWRLQVISAEVGVVSEEERVEGLVTRREEVVTAPSAALIMEMVVPGERVAAGVEVAVIGLVPPGLVRESPLQQVEEIAEPDPDLWEKFKDYWTQALDAVGGEEESPAEEAAVMVEETPAVDPAAVPIEEIIVIRAHTPGLLSHYIDGWEVFTGPLYRSKDRLGPTRPEGYYTAEGDLVEAGRPLFKIVDNWSWYFNIILPLHSGRPLLEKRRVELEFDFAPGEKVWAELYHYEIDEKRREVGITYLIDRQISGFEQVRWTGASLLHSRLQGIIVPEEALFEKERQPGVYLNQGGRVIFRPVTVIARRDGQILVEGLEPASLVITRPELVEEGQRLN